MARAVLGAALLLSCVLSFPVPASAAGYSRRIAIAPFASLTKEDIGATVSVLPRLLASRLMALAGADVVLLPAGGMGPEAAAREAKVPLLLQGTVSKLGKGYSVDTTVTDLETGKPAGAFFAVAATEDDIIAQLGVLSGEIAEKLFGVQGAIRATSPPAAVAASPAPSMLPAPSGIPAIGGPSVAATLAPPPASVPATSAEGWTPSSLKQVGQSDKVADELFGVMALDAGAEGESEIVAWGSNILYFYRVKGTEVLPFSRITKEKMLHFLNVDAADIDGDGVKELVATCLVGDQIRSFVYKKGKDTYSEAAWDIPYFLAVVVDAQGKRVVVGQNRGIDYPFRGKLYRMIWDGKTLKEGEAFPANTNIKPLNQGVLGLSAGKFGGEWQWAYTDEDSHLRVLDPAGKTVFLSKERYGAGLDLFEWGPFNRTEQKRMQFFLRKAARISEGAGGKPILLISEVDKGILTFGRSWDKSRLVLLQWEDGSFSEKAGTKMEGRFSSGADFLSVPLRRGGGIIASVVEQEGSAYKDKISRLVLYRAE
ncbi:hypothetical protein [Candidatus Deferrimicrobium sp.]|uniref:hypothetical protein n=1 Tax=Candidatus Deferrimicrobium sp. TaxID=3060586 RepID=UPI0027243143|nr:hypothetical protein [Candidatus Deferrimicrobium sp.]MDO8738526.1 hypothetical protein [Candidatus Deferrimicrobium sp.]